jgi:hypothetical protein
VEILFQSHHAEVSERIRERARTAVTRFSARLACANAVTLRVHGPTRRRDAPRPNAARWCRGERPLLRPRPHHAIDRADAQTRQSSAHRKPAVGKSLARESITVGALIARLQRGLPPGATGTGGLDDS